MTEFKETDLYEPMRAFLEEEGYQVQAEVKHCDIAAEKNGRLVVVELKRAFGLSRCSAELLEQSQCVIIQGATEQPPLLLHQITYTEYQSRNVEVHLLGGKTRLISMRQADFAALLLAYPYFCDCMRGVLVNLEQVESLTASHFLLSDGTSVPVSRLKYKEVREKYLSFAYARMRGGFTNGTL